MRKLVLLIIALSVMGLSNGRTIRSADIYKLEGNVDTLRYEQVPFEWQITPRYDYSKMLVAKLFMGQAKHNGEYLGKYKLCDNGEQTVEMTCEQAVAVMRGMDAITLGLPKIVYLVGWQYNGHDSKYPAFFEGNKSVARPGDANPLESIRWTMQEGRKYNTIVSLHINLFDAYSDSPLFDEYVRQDVLAKDKEGNPIIGDNGYKISYAAEWEKGLLQTRVDSLCKLLPIEQAGTIHVDAFHNNVPRPYLSNGKIELRIESPISPGHGHTAEQDIEAKKSIIRYFDKKGIDVTTEGVSNMAIGNIDEGFFPMYWHYNSIRHALSLKASQACGGNIYGIQRVFGYNLNVEQLFRNQKNYNEAFKSFKQEFCLTTLICQYLNTFDRIAIVDGKNGNAVGILSDGVRTMVRDNKMYVAKDGEPLAEDGDVFIPAVWLGANAIVAFSRDGYSARTWTIPTGAKLSRNVKGWVIDADGRMRFKNFKKKGRQITLTLAPGEMVLLEG